MLEYYNRYKMKKLTTGLLIFLITGVAVFFGIQFFTKTGIFKVPGVVTYDESLSESEIAFLKPLFPEDKILDYDVKISATTLQNSASPENSLLFDVLIPTTDFYDARSSISSAEAESILTSINELNPTKKLLAIDNNYYLDTFDSGAFYRFFKF